MSHHNNLKIIFNKHSNRWTCQGYTLIEVIVAILVLGLGLTGLTLLYFTSADKQIMPIQRMQAKLISESLLDHVLITKAWHTCQKDTNKISICDFFSDTPQPLKDDMKALRYHANIKLGEEKIVSGVRMQPLKVWVYAGPVEMATLITWIVSD